MSDWGLIDAIDSIETIEQVHPVGVLPAVGFPELKRLKLVVNKRDLEVDDPGRHKMHKIEDSRLRALRNLSVRYPAGPVNMITSEE